MPYRPFRLIRRGLVIPLLLLSACASVQRWQPPMPLSKDITEYARQSYVSNLSPGQLEAVKDCMRPQTEAMETAITKVFKHFQDASLLLKTDAARALPFIAEDINKWTRPRLGTLDAAMLWPGGSLSELISEISKPAPANPVPLVKDYLAAYFGSGGSLFVALDAKDKNKWPEEIAKALKVQPNSPLVGNVLANLPLPLDLDGLALPPGTSNFHIQVPKDEPGFVSRDGTRYKFPGVTWKGSSAAIDHSQVGADLIRVILEALRDTYAPLPTVANATIVKSQAKGRFKGVEIFNPESNSWHVNAEDFQNIEANANQAESVVAGAVGKAIRGGSWGSLNNEALAKAVETAAGVFARHSVEWAGWCASKVRGMGRL